MPSFLRWLQSLAHVLTFGLVPAPAPMSPPPQSAPSPTLAELDARTAAVKQDVAGLDATARASIAAHPAPDGAMTWDQIRKQTGADQPDEPLPP